MRRLVAGAVLALMTALVPLCVRADDAAPPITVTLPHFEHAAAPLAVPTRTILYILQAYDAVQTAAALRRPGLYEQNATVRPFTRGGAAGIAFGFALGDLFRDRLLRRAPESLRESANEVQAFANLDGIIETRRTLTTP